MVRSMKGDGKTIHSTDTGIWTYPNGETYEGEWKGFDEHGQVIITYPDGTTKKGEYVAGELQWIRQNIDNVYEEKEEENKEEKQEARTRRIPIRVQREVWRRDQGKCQNCGSRKNLEYDHIIPFSEGGSNTVRNIELLCEECNRKKSNNIG